MTEAKHTPGPWKIGNQTGNHWEPITIVTVPDGECIITINPIGSVDEQEANARLVLAGSDLLNAVEQMIDLFRNTDGDICENNNPVVQAALDSCVAASKKARLGVA